MFNRVRQGGTLREHIKFRYEQRSGRRVKAKRGRSFYTIFFLLILLALLIISPTTKAGAMTPFSPLETLSDQNGSIPVELGQGEYRSGESPADKEGNPLWLTDQGSTGWQKVGLMQSHFNDPDLHTVWYRENLPAGNWPNPTLLVPQDLGNYTIYLNGKLIGTTDPSHNINRMIILNEVRYLIPLEPSFGGKLLVIREDLPLGISGTPINGVIGARADLLRMSIDHTNSNIGHNIFSLFLGFFFILIGPFILIFFFFQRKYQRQQKTLFYFGGFVLVMGFLFADDGHQTFDLIIGINSHVSYYLSIISFYLTGVFGTLFYAEMVSTKYKRYLQITGLIHLIYTIGAITLIFLELIKINSTRTPYFFLLLIDMFIMGGILLTESRRANKEIPLFTLGGGILVITVTIDALNGLNIISDQPTLTPWGVLALLVTNSLILGRRFLVVHQQLGEYAQDLEIKSGELAEKNSALVRLDTLKDEFLANTSHELRTPLNGIIGIAESMIDGATGPISKKQAFNLDLIVYSGRRLASLVNDILDFAKLKHEGLYLQLKLVGLYELSDIVLTVSQPLAAKKGLRLVNEISPDFPPVRADENRLQQIMHNLIGNAIKFTHQGSITVSARIESTTGQLTVQVKDTGIGIPLGKLERIFESFEQVDGTISREFGGTGLGLSITRQLVALHGGTIEVVSEEGIGSTFSFTLPLATTDEIDQWDTNTNMPILKITPLISRLSRAPELNEGDLNDETDDKAEGLTPEKGHLTVLVVDDEPVNLQVVVNHLSLHNYIVKEATNGPEALAMIEAGLRPDLILLDIMMPKMSGYEVCRKLRQRFAAQEAPIILLTAKNQVGDLVEGFAAGANDYLSKPFSKDELLARIKTHIRLAKINIAYSRFVPYELLQHLERENIVEVRLGDHVETEMSILFSDIRAFTTMSEDMTPQENFDFINTYLQRVGPVIRNYGGFIDKYIGDAIMALFPVPTSAEDSLKTAIEMIRQVTLYNEWARETGQLPIKIGVGLLIGRAMLGIIGEKERLEGTVISDAVNLASRLEGLTKTYGASILISEELYNRLPEPDQYDHRFLGHVKIKGKKSAVGIFEIFNEDMPEIREMKRRSKLDFENGVRHYEEKEFALAGALFQAILELAPDDKATAYYLAQCLDLALKI